MTEDLPNGWQRIKLGELGDWTSGGTPSRMEPSFYGPGLPWVKTGDLPDGPVVNIPESITELGLKNSSAKLLPRGTLLVAMYGATIGRLGLLECEAATNQACAALLPNGRTADLIPYVFQYLLGQREELRRIGQGGAQPNISQTILKDFEIPLPPLNEQRRIVARLEALQARSRRAREALDAIPPLLEKLRQSILAAAFRGDLTKDWRAKQKDLEPATELLKRIRTARRQKWEATELVKLKSKGRPPTDDSWRARYVEPDPVDEACLKELPNGWCWASLDELTFVAGGITKGQKRNPSDTLRSVPYLRVANVQRGHLNLSEMKTIEASEAEIAELQLIRGDILLNEGGDRDKLGRGWVWEEQLRECIHQNHVFRARPILDEIESRYLSHYANEMGQTFFVDQGKQTTNLASVSISRVRRFPIALPPSSEQCEIIAVLDNQLSRAASIEDVVRTARQQATVFDRGMLAKAFRGELVPQDPNDEPAQVVLARARSGSGLDAANGTPKKRGRPRSSQRDGHPDD